MTDARPRPRPFVHLHCHTHYSLLDGANRIDALVKKVKASGMNAAAITDHGNLYGALEFYNECRANEINPIIGYEATYSYNRANQVYSAFPISFPSSACPVGIPCTPSPAIVSANAHEITGDWIASVKVANLRPFALAGVGALFDVPVSSSAGSTSTTTKPVYVYGAGIDWGLLPHLGLRLQYRGNLYQAPNLSKLYTSVDAFTHTAEPMVGVYFRL